jgi:hypothetical protein
MNQTLPTPMHSLRASALILTVVLAAAVPLRADLNADLAFTAFQNVDVNSLASGTVLQARGPLTTFPRGITSQSLLIIDAQPADVAAKLVHWNPAAHSDLKVWLHKSGLTQQPTPANFSDLGSLPDNSSVQFQIDSTAKYAPGSTTLQVSKEEGQLITATAAQEKDPKALFVKAWSQILAARVTDFFAGRGGAAVDVAPGGDIHPVSDVKSLLHADLKVYGQYQRLLNTTPIKALAGSTSTKTTPADIYCDIFDVEGSAAMGTGAIFQAPNGTALQSADIEFYTNYGVYCTIELEELWPITVNGKTQTLVWRDDLVSAPNIAYLHGVDRLGASMIMLQETKEGVVDFRSEFK